MTALITASGRLGRDPETRTSKAGREFVSVTVAVDVERGDGAQPWWLKIMASGRHGTALAEARKGDSVVVVGKVQRDNWTGQDGQNRVTWVVWAEQIVHAGMAAPKGGAQQQRHTPPHQQRNAADADRAVAAQAPLDDEIPF